MTVHLTKSYLRPSPTDESGSTTRLGWFMILGLDPGFRTLLYPAKPPMKTKSPSMAAKINILYKIHVVICTTPNGETKQCLTEPVAAIISPQVGRGTCVCMTLHSQRNKQRLREPGAAIGPPVDRGASVCMPLHYQRKRACLIIA